jgi:hypothetical protein
VIVEPPRVQVRRLEGLPALNDSLLARIVSENASALFLKREPGVIVTKPHRDGDALWGAALDRDVVEGVAAVARELRFELRAVAAWSDLVDRTCDPVLVAARVDHRTPLAWSCGDGVSRDHARRRPTAMIASLVVAAGAAWGAPVLHDILDERRMVRELSLERNAEVEGRRSLAELAQVTRSLDDRMAFEGKRGRMTALIAELTHALPESTAIVSLRVDSANVNLVALGPRVTEVLPHLTDARAAWIVGRISHESIDGARFERAALRFPRATRRYQ